jgi:hypothetical protein
MWTDTAAALKLRLNPWQSLGSVEPGPIVVSAPAQTRFTVATSGGPNEGEVPSAHNPHDLYSKGQAKAQCIEQRQRSGWSPHHLRVGQSQAFRSVRASGTNWSLRTQFGLSPQSTTAVRVKSKTAGNISRIRRAVRYRFLGSSAEAAASERFAH